MIVTLVHHHLWHSTGCALYIYTISLQLSQLSLGDGSFYYFLSQHQTLFQLQTTTVEIQLVSLTMITVIFIRFLSCLPIGVLSECMYFITTVHRATGIWQQLYQLICYCHSHSLWPLMIPTVYWQYWKLQLDLLSTTGLAHQTLVKLQALLKFNMYISVWL